jgi:hypothetical protein
MAFCDLSPGGAHNWAEATTIHQAASEGMADFFPCIVNDSAISIVTSDGFLDTFWIDVESGLYGILPDTSGDGSQTNLGTSSEAGVAGILWDIYDNVNDDYTTFNQIRQFYNPDDRGDDLTLADPVSDIYDVLLSRTIADTSVKTIHDLHIAWFQNPSHGYMYEMDDIFHEHGSCCAGYTGDINDDGAIVPTLTDLTVLINYLFVTFDPLPCPTSADVSGDGNINLTDVNKLTNYLFVTFETLAKCKE